MKGATHPWRDAGEVGQVAASRLLLILGIGLLEFFVAWVLDHAAGLFTAPMFPWTRDIVTLSVAAFDIALFAQVLARAAFDVWEAIKGSALLKAIRGN
jgi:hypothetical protein